MIRPAEPTDTDAVAEIARTAFEHYIPRIGLPPVPMLVDYAAAITAGKVWVAVDAGSVLGFVLLEDESDSLLLDVLAVSPTAQGKGIGAALLTFTESEARSRGHHLITLCTNEAMTENLTYYPHHGYTETTRETTQGRHRVFFEKFLDG